MEEVTIEVVRLGVLDGTIDDVGIEEIEGVPDGLDVIPVTKVVEVVVIVLDEVVWVGMVVSGVLTFGEFEQPGIIKVAITIIVKKMTTKLLFLFISLLNIF